MPLFTCLQGYWLRANSALLGTGNRVLRPVLDPDDLPFDFVLGRVDLLGTTSFVQNRLVASRFLPFADRFVQPVVNRRCRVRVEYFSHAAGDRDRNLFPLDDEGRFMDRLANTLDRAGRIARLAILPRKAAADT